MSQRAWDAQFRDDGDAPTFTDSARKGALDDGQMDDGRPTVDRVDPRTGAPTSDSRVLEARPRTADAGPEIDDVDELLTAQHLTALRPLAPPAPSPRPYGLAAGEFTVPDDFDGPLADDILRTFEE